MDHLYDMLKLAKIVKIGINILKISVDFACCILTKQLRRHHTYNRLNFCNESKILNIHAQL